MLRYQADVAEVKQAEGSGGNRFSLDEVLQDIRGCGLDVTKVLRQRRFDRLNHERGPRHRISLVYDH